MKDKLFYNNPVFRILAPTMIGTLIYLLILMFFDSLDMLADNFFSRELLFVIGLTYLVLELNRLIVIIFNSISSLEEKIVLRIILQYIIAIVITSVIIAGVLYLYFIYIEGFSTIQTELITFNALFLLVVIFYLLFFFSIIYLNRQNLSKVGKEEVLRENLEIELQTFKNQINPDLLFQSLEIIISVLHSNKKHADNLIENLSKTYRYTLDNKHNDLVPLSEELNSLIPLSEIYKSKYCDAFGIEMIVAPESKSMNIIPGTLNLLLENALTENIVTESLPLVFKVKTVENRLIVEYLLNEKISVNQKSNTRLDFLCKAYAYYSSTGLETLITDDTKTIKVPLLEIEED